MVRPQNAREGTTWKTLNKIIQVSDLNSLLWSKSHQYEGRTRHMVVAFLFLHFIILYIFKGRKGGRSVLKERGCHVPAALCQLPWQVTTLFPWTGSIVKRTKQRLRRNVACRKSGAWQRRSLKHKSPMLIPFPSRYKMPKFLIHAKHTHTWFLRQLGDLFGVE